MKTIPTTKNVHRKLPESGIAVVWLIGFLLVFGTLAAIVIDILRVQAILRQAQNAADAAALAGARILDGNVRSWGDAKRFAVETLRHQRIGGIGSLDLSQLSFNDDQGLLDPLEAQVLEQNPLELPDPDRYVSNQAVVGPVRFIIERGAYWMDGAEFRFFPLEGIGDGTEQTSVQVAHPIAYSGIEVSKVPVRYDVPVHLVANAVRVTAQLTGIRAFFGNFVGISVFGTMGRSAVAVSDPVNYPVLPLAVPACALLLDTDADADSSYQYDTAEFHPEKQCIRETVFTESDPMGPRPMGEAVAPFNERAAGVTRAESYPWRSNPRALSLPGVLAVPESTHLDQNDNFSEEPIRAADFAQILTEAANNGGIRARIGEYVRPLENGVFASGLLNSFSLEATNALEKLISSGIPFTSAFTDARGRPLPNYPRLRGTDQPVEVVKVGDNAELRMQQFPNDPDTGLPAFQNPMCTHSGFRELKLTQRKALPVNIMVVTPTTRDQDGNPNAYCRYDQVFNGTLQDTTPVFASTRPRIVGFVRAYLFDFRFEQYPGRDPCRGQNQGPTCERVNLPNPAGIMMKGVYEPFFEEAEQFIIEHSNWRACRMRAMRCNFPNPPPSCPVDCGGSPNPPRPPNDNTWQTVTAQRCFDMPTFPQLMACLNNPTDLNMSSCLSMFRTAKSPDGFPMYPEVVREGDTCLPMREPGCTPLDDPRCTTPPKPIEAQYGCGGIRSRLDCGAARLTSPGSAADKRPMLVS